MWIKHPPKTWKEGVYLAPFFQYKTFKSFSLEKNSSQPIKENNSSKKMKEKADEKKFNFIKTTAWKQVHLV